MRNILNQVGPNCLAIFWFYKNSHQDFNKNQITQLASFQALDYLFDGQVKLDLHSNFRVIIGSQFNRKFHLIMDQSETKEEQFNSIKKFFKTFIKLEEISENQEVFILNSDPKITEFLVRKTRDFFNNSLQFKSLQS